MDVLRVEMELPEQYPVVTLLEAEPPRRELFCTVLGRLGADVVAVRLTGRQGAVYLAELDLMSARGREVVACRPSDGITVALRLPVQAPILADERLLSGDGDVVPAAG